MQAEDDHVYNRIDLGSEEDSSVVNLLNSAKEEKSCEMYIRRSSPKMKLLKYTWKCFAVGFCKY